MDNLMFQILWRSVRKRRRSLVYSHWMPDTSKYCMCCPMLCIALDRQFLNIAGILTSNLCFHTVLWWFQLVCMCVSRCSMSRSWCLQPDRETLPRWNNSFILVHQWMPLMSLESHRWCCWLHRVWMKESGCCWTTLRVSSISAPALWQSVCQYAWY